MIPFMSYFAQARKHMVECQIQPNGVKDEGILKAYASTPRELFLPDEKKETAYIDDDIFYDDQRFILAPMVHARMIAAAAPRTEDVALDIGVASGYSSAILSHLVSTVVALEQKQAYIDQAMQNWDDLDMRNIVGVKGKLKNGYSKSAPYDLIILNGALASVPENICSQIAKGGRMVMILREAGRSMGRAVLVRPCGEGQISTTTLFETGATYLPGFEPEAAFTF